MNKLDKRLTEISLAYIAEDRKREYDELVKAIEDNPKEWHEYLKLSQTAPTPALPKAPKP